MFRAQSRGRSSQGGFDPDERESHELGVKLDIADRVGATAAVFDVTRSNIVTAVDDDFFLAVGEARSRGFELDLTAQLAPNLNLIAAYAWTDAEVTEDIEENAGNRLQNVARNLASVSLWYQPEPRFGLKGGGRAVTLFSCARRRCGQHV
ncbi:TonB-dependent receptor [Pseudomonas fulva]|nr:TonB-dependent receptor [Pseudomonas fulva]MBF8781358.1 TonB-dependent receptor [Pseudomonas fulva]